VKRLVHGAAVLSIAALVLAACGEAPDETTTTSGSTGDAGATDYKACMVSDSGGFDDQSFNQAAKEGLDQAESELGIEVVELESAAETDFTPNVDQLVSQSCNLIIGVGFLLEDPIQTAAEANPDTDFALIDSSFSAPDFSPVELENGKPLLFNTAEAAYLAGYLAAGTTKTGTVATFGGIQLPSVAIFMDGFSDGIAAYNEAKGTDVKLLGWDKESQTGAFTGDFENQSNGTNQANTFMDQGADIILPVAGPVGLGAAAAAKERGEVNIIWVDSDGYLTTEYGDIILTSVMKNMGPAVFDTVAEAVEGSYSSEPYVGTLENEGIGLAPYHDLESAVPAELADEVEALKEQIISGDLVVESPNSP
jgi:basic membrane protein A and related proteins